MDTKSITILLVDDDADFVGVTRHLLGPFQGRTFNVIWENDGDKALQRLKSGTPVDLVLMDYYLPDSNGLEIIRRMADEHLAVPIIVLTANRDYRAAVEAMKHGAEDYLLKEETTDTILPRTILSVLDRVALKQQIASTERHNLLSLKRTEAVKDLIVTMCHEFNNPLAAIKMSAAILARNQTGEREIKLLKELNDGVTKVEDQILKLRDLNSGE